MVRKISSLALHWQILIAMALAVVAGSLSGTEAEFLGIQWFALYSFLGTLFLNALKMLVVPLVVSAIITGVASISLQGGLGRLGLKTLGYYLMTSAFAITIGLVVGNLMQPGEHTGGMQVEAEVSESIAQKVEGRSLGDVAEIFLRMVPENIVAAAAEMQLLGLIFFSMLFGYFMMKIDSPYRDTLYHFWQGVFEVMMKITDWVMKFAPLGVFGLVAAAVAKTGLEQFLNLATFFFTVVLALGIHFFIVMPLVLRFVGGVKNPWRHYKAMEPALLTAFSTSSSSATLPITLDTIEKNTGVPNRYSSFVLPLGATVNMDGTALYISIAVIFIAQQYGMQLDWIDQLMIMVTTLMASIGVAGIPAASLVAITIILVSMGLPTEAIGLIMVVDRLLDMMRTAVNVFSDTVGAVVIARSEGEKQVYGDG